MRKELFLAEELQELEVLQIKGGTSVDPQGLNGVCSNNSPHCGSNCTQLICTNGVATCGSELDSNCLS